MSSFQTLLIIDDDRLFCKALAAHLSQEEYHVFSAHSLEEGEKLFRQQEVGVVLLDQRLPDGNGIDLCNTILALSDQVKVIFITAFPSFDNAVTALRKGAYDYLSKPLEIEEVALTVQQAFRTLRLENVEHVQQYKYGKEQGENVLIGQNGGLINIYNHIQLAADNDVPVLITGETGTGKNVVAKTIHYLNPARNNCFIDINCAALPENLIEAELFGHEKGAFTGAISAKKGIFELADGGTLFLDEIGELPLHLQAKLLGVLDEQKVKRLGGETYKQVSVKIIAATNIDLESAVKAKTFRQDLFFRLSVLPLQLPPLRERKEDIAPLCQYFLQQSLLHQDVSLSHEEIEKLKLYDWPGNVRELKNIIERSLLFRREREIFPSELIIQQDLQQTHASSHSPHTLQTLAEVEKNHILKSLDLLSGNHSKTAKTLGISRSTLLRKLKGYSNEE